MEADIGTGVIHNYIKSRQLKSFIFVLEIDGVVWSGPHILFYHVCSFFTNFYSDNSPSASYSLDIGYIIPRLVTDMENQLLLDISTIKKIKRAVYSMDQHSAHGPNRFPCIFY